MIIDLHVHTRYSFDCMMKPEKILKIARRRGLTGIAVCDHNTIQGGLACRKMNTDDQFLVIVGAEISTDVGDVTGLCLKEEISSRTFADVVQEIRSQGGLVLLNHPFKGHKLEVIDFDQIDLIEGYNSRVNLVHNLQAVQLANEKNKPLVAGSDAHLYNEIGNCRTFYRSTDDLLHPVKTEYHRNVFYAELYSQWIKAKKLRDVRVFLKLLKRTPGYLLKRVVEG